MNKLRKLKTAKSLLFGDKNAFIASIVENCKNIIPEKLYLELLFKYKMGYKLNLTSPQSFSEKLQWLKLYYRKPELTIMVDKVKAKEYVANLIGWDHIIPTIAVYDKADDIEMEDLPNKFVLKCNHDSSDVIICTDKSQFNIEEAKIQLSDGLKTSFYSRTKEWPYKNVQRKIICEKYMVDESGYELKDYKWFCFDGEPKAMFVASDRTVKNVETKFDFYDMDFNHLNLLNGHPNSSKKIEKPKGFEEMKELARVLSKNLPHVRVDFYDVNGKIYFGELTFFHWSGLMPFEPITWDYTFGSWLNLPSKDK